MAVLFGQYASGTQFPCGTIGRNETGASGLNPIVDRLNSISNLDNSVTGSVISGTTTIINCSGISSINGPIVKMGGSYFINNGSTAEMILVTLPYNNTIINPLNGDMLNTNVSLISFGGVTTYRIRLVNANGSLYTRNYTATTVSGDFLDVKYMYGGANDWTMIGEFPSSGTNYASLDQTINYATTGSIQLLMATTYAGNIRGSINCVLFKS